MAVFWKLGVTELIPETIQGQVRKIPI